MVLTIGIASLSACHEKTENRNKEITIEAFRQWQREDYVIDHDAIREHLNRLSRVDKDSTQTDYFNRKYYRSGSPLLWIDIAGVDSRADLFLDILRTVTEIGFTTESFDVDKIEEDIRRIRNLDFDHDNEKAEVYDINKVLADVEYRLTKAYLRYCTGQRFGYVNPTVVLNRLDPLDSDSIKRELGFRTLFDIAIERPDKNFYDHALSMISDNKIKEFVDTIQPTDKDFLRLKEMLADEKVERKRRLILCNMERLRWRQKEQPEISDKRKIVVNIPAYHLYAYGPDSVMTMRIGCGTKKTKTPLLTSSIYRIDINPVWNIPMSIIRKDIARHAGDRSYFDRNRYYIVERETGDRMDVEDVSAAMLRGGNYRVSQEGGEGNSLGRIIFRFINNFSVFMHDTSTRGFFQRDNRDVSHGCVRVERPFDLAQFVLGGEGDEWTLDRIRISMDMEPMTVRGMKYVAKEEEKREKERRKRMEERRKKLLIDETYQGDNGDIRLVEQMVSGDEPEETEEKVTYNLIRSKEIDPQVPLYIVYYTFYKDEKGAWREYPDVYGYDAVIGNRLASFRIN